MWYYISSIINDRAELRVCSDALSRRCTIHLPLKSFDTFIKMGNTIVGYDAKTKVYKGCTKYHLAKEFVKTQNISDVKYMEKYAQALAEDNPLLHGISYAIKENEDNTLSVKIKNLPAGFVSKCTVDFKAVKDAVFKNALYKSNNCKGIHIIYDLDTRYLSELSFSISNTILLGKQIYDGDIDLPLLSVTLGKNYQLKGVSESLPTGAIVLPFSKHSHSGYTTDYNYILNKYYSTYSVPVDLSNQEFSEKVKVNGLINTLDIPCDIKFPNPTHTFFTSDIIGATAFANLTNESKVNLCMYLRKVYELNKQFNHRNSTVSNAYIQAEITGSHKNEYMALLSKNS